MPSTPMETDNISLLKSYLKAVERGATGQDLASFLTDDVIQENFPNQLLPQGATRNLEEILDATLRGQHLMQGQRFTLVNAIDNGDMIAVELEWSCILAMPMGTLPAGGEMHGRFASFIEFRDGKIARQRNYNLFFI